MTMVSQDAAIVLGLASVSIPFAHSREDEAERWLRVLRLHGRVGEALQSLGIGEAPLMTPATARRRNFHLAAPGAGGDAAVQEVCAAAEEMAAMRGTDRVSTLDILFAVLETYGSAFDRALYVRGSSRVELLDRLPAYAEADYPR
jgi:hypothetical protein